MDGRKMKGSPAGNPLRYFWGSLSFAAILLVWESVGAAGLGQPVLRLAALRDRRQSDAGPRNPASCGVTLQ